MLPLALHVAFLSKELNTAVEQKVSWLIFKESIPLGSVFCISIPALRFRC